MSAAEAAEAACARPAGRTRHVVAAAVAGNALEFYDFVAYGFFAQPIAHTFFRSTRADDGLLAAFATFGVSFLARPVGAAVLGAYADRNGRRAAMTLAVVLMTIGTLGLVVVPGREAIGIAAPLLVLLARLVQGFSLGGEYGASTALLIEHDHKRAGFLASFQPVSQSVSAALAAFVGWALGALMAPAAFDRWGFRIAFLVGTAIGPVGLLLRRTLPPDAPAAASPGGAPTRAVSAIRTVSPIRDVLLGMKARVLIGAASIAIGTGVTYLGVYLPTYAAEVLHMRLSSGLGAAALSYVLSVPVLLGGARLVQGMRPARVMAWSTVVTMLAVWPLFALLGRFPNVAGLVGVRVALFAIGAPYFALQPVMLAGLFPRRLRVTGIATGYTLGIVLFGGFAPAEIQWLIGATGNPKAPAFLLAATGVVTLVSLALAKRLPALSDAPPDAAAAPAGAGTVRG